ncbi:UDP-N-acetylglucosamine 1-carboxyvinyltransferase [Patescibacteria group bacterium]|nr:UDP-N-acetylglucosamine 1-carboxyvinyltransferase [Patescibacteria group bacterium]
MNRYLIEGGIPLHGEYTVSGAKNAALKLLIASLLTSEPVTIKNVPRISDTEAILEILQFLGAKTQWRGQNEVVVEAKKINGKAIPLELASKCRASVLVLGALTARCHEAVVPGPCGEKVDSRPVDRHIDALRQLGVDVIAEGSFFHARGGVQGGVIEFAKNTHTGTENVLIASVFTQGEVIIKNAADEPEIDNLIMLLNAMGAQIKRTQPREIRINGVEKLHAAKATVMGDRIEAVTIAVATAITRGEVQIKGILPEYLTAAFSKLQEIGVNFKVSQDKLLVWVTPETRFNPVGIESHPYPGFMTDWLPLFAALLTQAEGESVLHETIYPSRFAYIKHLKRMGAEIHLFNPTVGNANEFYNFNPEDNQPEYFHAARIFGPVPLMGTKLEADSIRAAAALVIAALAAKGPSELIGVEYIERGYEDLVGKFKKLGAKIEVVGEEPLTTDN